MPFPDQPRVKYQQNPLVEVLCQWVFDDKTKAELSNLDAADAAQVHDAIKEKFPLFNIAKKVGIEVNAQQQSVQQHEDEQYEFRSLDNLNKVDLTKDGITLTTAVYSGWESFKGDFLYFIDLGLKPIIGDLGIQRIGLRYKDVIQRAVIGLENEPWTQLVNPYLSNLHHKDNEIAASIIGANSQILIQLPNNQGHLNVAYGLITNAQTSELCFLIDSDFFYEGLLNELSAREYMDRYNLKARNFFRWCISEQLHNALVPKGV